ncbi:MAG: hypothetical protein A3G87_02135 [Omnitrophica bacterium RIFCSPLOWO2_12_FULL_50_11]|nr:MAG: hypothetical protein A3G87_02135 [Omnitrophica bacterium RIFCSPLOWO2_12_FULL_50_11]
MKERRFSARHFIELPIHYRKILPEKGAEGVSTSVQERSRTKNLSDGGLLFLAPKSYRPGTQFELSFPVKGKVFSLKASVVHSLLDPATGFYETGMCFSNPSELFKIRMAEQLYQIDKFRKKLSEVKGYAVSEEEAAKRWIEEHSAEFAEFYR